MFIVDIKKKFYYTKNVSSSIIMKILRSNEIIIDSSKRNKSFIKDEDIERVCKVLDNLQFCNSCGNKFRLKNLRYKYCSKKCQTDYAKKRYKSGLSISRAKARETDEELSSCSVECMLKEFGDIE